MSLKIFGLFFYFIKGWLGFVVLVFFCRFIVFFGCFGERVGFWVVVLSFAGRYTGW